MGASVMRRLALCGLVVLSLGCNQLLDVDVPGAVASDALSDPDLMPSLVVSARGELECALGAYINGQAFMTNEIISSSSWRNFNVWTAHLLELKTQTGACPTSTSTTSAGFYVALSSARFQNDDVYRRVDAFTPEELTIDKAQTLGVLAAMSGYAHTMMGEGFCEMAIDGGPLMTRAQVFEKALEKFVTAKQHADAVSDAALQNLSLVGQARVLLNLARGGEAAAAASQVPQGFGFDATYSTANPRRQNRIYLNNQHNRYVTMGPDYLDLTVGGQPDTRVAIDGPTGVGHDAKTPFFTQSKYPAANSPIPIATWREAWLIIAEAELGQSAVDRINDLRTAASLPLYAPADVNDDAEILAQVIEERRRELFLEGHRLNDMLRHNVPFPTGINHLGEPYGPVTCLPLPDTEVNGNPNL